MNNSAHAGNQPPTIKLAKLLASAALLSGTTIKFASKLTGDTAVLAYYAGQVGFTTVLVPNVMAQYLRFDVTAASGANPGAAEFQFYGPVPEPAAGGLLAVFAVLGCGRRGRRSLFPR